MSRDFICFVTAVTFLACATIPSVAGAQQAGDYTMRARSGLNNDKSHTVWILNTLSGAVQGCTYPSNYCTPWADHQYQRNGQSYPIQAGVGEGPYTIEVLPDLSKDGETSTAWILDRRSEAVRACNYNVNGGGHQDHTITFCTDWIKGDPAALQSEPDTGPYVMHLFLPPLEDTPSAHTTTSVASFLNAKTGKIRTCKYTIYNTSHLQDSAITGCS